MLVLNPRSVVFGGSAWEGVSSIVVDRSPARTIEDRTDHGPFATLVDVPEQRVRIRVVQELAGDAVGSPVPGDAGTLSFVTAPGASDAGRRRVSANAVVLEVAHEVSLRRGTVRTIELAAISADGRADPLTIAGVP